MKSCLDEWAKKISRKEGFILDEKIYQGNYYIDTRPRNVIYSGLYKSKQAVLKIYDDPRNTDEPISQKIFLRKNKNKILTAPKIYKYKIISPKSGWIIMERLPANGLFFKSPLSTKEKREFLKIYLEYKKYFPKQPHRKLRLDENLPANKFHLYRINNWLRLAADKEEEGGRIVMGKNKFIPRFISALKIIDKEFAGRKMEWIHGHFKPKEIFKINKGRYYLTDFAHTKMYPEGYEFSFMIWADCFISGDWRQSYKNWKKGIDSWIKEMQPIAKKLKIKKFHSLMRAGLLERALGTILADIGASDMTYTEKITRLNLLYKLIDDLT